MAWNENIHTLSDTWADGSKVKFLHGTQAALNAYMEAGNEKYGKAEEGAFYLTQDTSRLYVGRKTAANIIVPIPVNEGLTRVANQTNLPNTANVGDFYFIESDNILAVCSQVDMPSGVRRCKWTQLNDNTSITSVSYEVALDEERNQENEVIGRTASILFEILETNGLTKSDNFIISQGENITLSLTGDGTNNNKFTLDIAATDTKYNLSANSVEDAAQLQLVNQEDADDVDTVNIKGYKHNTEVITKVSVDNKNIVVESSVPRSIEMETEANQNGWNVVLKRGLLSNSSSTTVASENIFDPVVIYGATPSLNNGIKSEHVSNTVHFVNGSMDLSGVYTTDQTDDRILHEIGLALQGLNALRFVGVVETASDLAITDSKKWHIGDVVRVVSTNSIVSNKIDASYNYGKTSGGVPYVENGDLLIAMGQEDNNGEISSESLKFIPIPSGDEKTYTSECSASAAANNDKTTGNVQFIIREGDSTFVDFTATGSTKIIVDGENTGKELVATLKHAPVGLISEAVDLAAANNSTGDTYELEGSFSSTVHELTGTVTFYTYGFDATGHVVEQKAHTINLIDSHNYITNFTTAVEVTSNSQQATLTHEIEDNDNNVKSVDTIIKSDTLTFAVPSSTPETGTLIMDILWESF